MNRRAIIAFAALGLIWGSNFIFMKWATALISPVQVVFLRVLFGFLPIRVGAVPPKGTHLLPSSVAGMLSGAIPLFAFVMTALFLKQETMTSRKVGFGLLLLAAVTPFAELSSIGQNARALTGLVLGLGLTGTGRWM